MRRRRNARSGRRVGGEADEPVRRHAGGFAVGAVESPRASDRKSAGLTKRQFWWQLKDMANSLQIVATGVRYYHDADERAFFEWLDRMEFVREYYGVVRDLFIELNRFPTDADLWEIIGFCRRYGIDMTQLAKFETAENSRWMRDPEMVGTLIFSGRGKAESM